MLKTNYNTILRRLSKKLASIDAIDAIVLYGSFARGDYGAKSDVDLLLIADKQIVRKKTDGDDSRL